MRIGLVIYGPLSTISGGYLYDRKLVAYLEEQGDEVEIISLPWSFYGRHLTHNFSRQLAQRLRRANFDLLLQDELNHPSLFWLNQRLKRQAAYPLVSIVHHLRSSELRPAWQNRFYRAVERRYLDSVDGFVFNSRTTQQVVAAVVSERPSVVAYPAGDRFDLGIDEAAIAARAQEPGPLRIVFVGSLIPRKGLHHLLAALAQLPSDEWRLEAVGETAVAPQYFRSILRQIRTTNLLSQIRLHGPLDQTPLAAILARSQLLAVPSSYEGFGIVYLEGMGFGLPAIAGNSGAAHEIITPGQDGFMVDGADTAVLAGHIHNLHRDRQQLAAMSAAAHRRYLVHPTWTESMASVRRFLGSLMD